MANNTKRIEVDIGAAAAMLQANPELCAMMNELVGGPALIEAQAEIERLQAECTALRTQDWDALQALRLRQRPDLIESAMQIVREEWHRAVKEFKLRPGTPTEAVTARILERINALNIQERQETAAAQPLAPGQRE